MNKHIGELLCLEENSRVETRIRRVNTRLVIMFTMSTEFSQESILVLQLFQGGYPNFTNGMEHIYR